MTKHELINKLIVAQSEKNVNYTKVEEIINDINHLLNQAEECRGCCDWKPSECLKGFNM